MLFTFLERYTDGIKMKRFYREGLEIGKGTLVFDTDSFGSEPYLVHIGENCLIAPGVRLVTHDGAIRVINNREEYKLINNKYGKIDIRDNVYIGDNSIIMPNVVIGPNACILPGSVVYKSIPPDSVACGNPASVQKNTIEGFEKYYNNEIYPYYSKYYQKFRRAHL